MKIIEVAITCTVQVVVPDDVSFSASHLQEVLQRKVNDHRDGRYSFAHEMIGEGTRQAVRESVHQVILNRVSEKPEYERRLFLDRRNAEVAHIEASINVWEGKGGSLGVLVTAEEPHG